MFRRSKFKHVFGKPNKREFCYDDIRITKSSWDSTFCSVNPKFLAVITEAAGGGAFLVLPLDKYGRIERDAPLVAGHRAAVLDLQWCPFNDNLIASASEDCTVKVWEIPEEGVSGENLTEPVADLVAHQRRVGLVQWHPTAEHVLLSAGADNMVIMWNVYRQEVMLDIMFPDMVLSASFNYNGAKFACTCKDRKTRIVDARTGAFLVEGVCHDGNKPQRCVYLKDGRMVTTGFSKMSERQLALWSETDLSKPLEMQDLDSSNGVIFPYYDPDTNLLFLCGKGDSNIRYFEITDEQPFLYYISVYQSSDPQRGIGWMPKRGIDVTSNEITRFYKLHTKGLCEVIPFTVPRKSELFQDDLYPDTASDEPAITAEEWMEGRDVDPVLMSLKGGFVPKEKATKSKVPARSGLMKRSSAAAAAPVHSSGHSETPSTRQSAIPSKTSAAAAPPSRATTSTKVDNGPATTTPASITKSPTAAAPAPVEVSPSSSSSTPVASAQASVPPKELQQLLDDMRKMKIIIKGHEKRIKVLETRLKEAGGSVENETAANA